MATDSAFTQAGKKAGLESWRIEDLQPVAVPTADLHKLHSGDSYIFLKTSEATTYERTTHRDPHTVEIPYLVANPSAASACTTSGLTWHIHFWLGKDTSTDESGVAAYKSVELDDALSGVAVQHRECEGYESVRGAALNRCFSCLF
jgi:hypothetical protein